MYNFILTEVVGVDELAYYDTIPSPLSISLVRPLTFIEVIYQSYLVFCHIGFGY